MKPDGYKSPALDATFSALADPTRRAILARLRQGPASVGDLAAPFDMSQPAISKHLRVLEAAGLVLRDKDAQRRPARLNAAPMSAVSGWLEDFRGFWTENLNALDDLLNAQNEHFDPDKDL